MSSPASLAPPGSAATKYNFDADFQAKVAAMFARDTAFSQRTDGIILPEYFENQSDATLVSIGIDYYAKYKKAPSDKTVWRDLIAKAARDKRIRRDMVPLVWSRVDELEKVDISDREYVIERVSTFARHQAVSKAIIDSVGHLDFGNFAEIQSALQKAMSVGAQDSNPGYDFAERLEVRTEERLERAAGRLAPTGISTGFADIDRHLYHKGWGKKELSVVMGGPKSGKCVSRDTLIFTKDGLVEIGSLVNDSVEVGCFAEKKVSLLGRDGMEDSSHIYNSGLSKTLTVRTKKGFAVEGTMHHPMLVMGEDGRLSWKRLDEICVGDFMVVQRGRRVYGSNTDISYAVADANRRIASSKRKDAISPMSLPLRMTEDLAEWIAMFVAEGYCCRENSGISFTQKDPRILSRFVELSRSLFGANPNLQHQGDDKTPTVRFGSVALRSYLESLGVVWDVSSERVVPKSILCAPRDVVLKFLSTLIGLEGCVSKTSEAKVTFDLTMASERIIKCVHMLLLNEGVVSKFSVKRCMATNGHRILRDYYRLSVSGGRNMSAIREIGVYEERKNNSLGIEFGDSTARDWIPNTRGLIGEIMLEIQRSGNPLKSSFAEHCMARTLRRLRGGKSNTDRNLTYAFAEKLILEIDRMGVTGSACARLKELVSLGYYYDPVLSITDGECETVDLTVPGTHSFFANGLISHNTTFLIDQSIAAIGSINRYNVLYLTLEVAARIVGERCDANISRHLVNELGTHIYDVNDKIKTFMDRAGVFKIHEYPTGSLRVSDIRRLLERYKSEGIKFDMLVVDYADLMQPERLTDNSIENSKSIYVNLRGLAMEEDLAVLTATQTNREGAKRKVATMTDVGDDFNKVRIADVLISINKDDEDRAAGRARLYFAACRNQAGGFSITVSQDIDRMRFITGVIGIS